MSTEKKGGCCSPKVLIFTPVIAAIFMAIAYYHFQYSYSRFVKINFDDKILYTDTEFFQAQHDRYKMIFYSSNIEEQYEFVKRVQKADDEVILAVDFHQNRSLPSNSDRIYVTSGANTILYYLSHFKITQLPTVVFLEKNQQSGYSQASPAKPVSSGEMKLVLRQPLTL